MPDLRGCRIGWHAVPQQRVLHAAQFAADVFGVLGMGRFFCVV
ncbi:hypothetical protein HMPREF9120_01427 [Neisseria sp. oral taxon 020 str. F0370]|nr:hypothetical protein HMPREF9120_01427 [Neisseria sp. oral taxon 020 str. F0370]